MCGEAQWVEGTTVHGRMSADTLWTSRARQAAAKIGKAIVAGQHLPGATLPREDELAGDLGVSRNTLREAMKALAAKSLVEIAPRRGTVVLPRDRWNVLDPDVLDWSGPTVARDQAFINELMATRAAVEPAAAAEAAVNGNTAQKAAVLAAWEAMAALAQSADIPAKVDTDLAWHVSVAAASNNRFLVSIMGSIAHALREHLRILNDRAGNYEGNLENHHRVAEAIASGDSQLARTAMEALVARAADDTSRLLEGQQARTADHQR